MKVSIIIRAYNSERTIKKAVESALSQNFPKKDFEVVAINDGSSDKTLEILKSYKKRIRLINQKRKGAIAAANQGFKIARGKCVILLDSDDYFERNILKEMIAILEENPEADFAYCDYYEKFPQGETKIISTKDNIFNSLASGIMFRKNKLAEEGFYNEKIKFPEYDLLFKTQGKWQGYHIGKPLFCYNRNKQSQTKNKQWVLQAMRELENLYPKKIKEIKKIRKY